MFRRVADGTIVSRAPFVNEKGTDPMIRRHAIAAVAVAMMGLVAAAPAEAGFPTVSYGATGLKKNANVRLRNTTTKAYFVVITPNEYAGKGQLGGYNAGTVGFARNLGGILVNPGASVLYPVPAGTGIAEIYLPSDVQINNWYSFMPADLDFNPYTVAGGGTTTLRITPGPLIMP